MEMEMEMDRTRSGQTGRGWVGFLCKDKILKAAENVRLDATASLCFLMMMNNGRLEYTKSPLFELPSYAKPPKKRKKKKKKKRWIWKKAPFFKSLVFFFPAD